MSLVIATISWVSCVIADATVAALLQSDGPFLEVFLNELQSYPRKCYWSPSWSIAVVGHYWPRPLFQIIAPLSIYGLPPRLAHALRGRTHP